MGELKVRFDGRTLALSEDESLGFGRTAIDVGVPVGWHYAGRFLSLDPDDRIHRVWGEIVFRHGLWNVRSLGSTYGVSVQFGGRPPIDLQPQRSADLADEPDSLAVTAPDFTILLAAGPLSYRIECSSDVGAEPSPAAAAVALPGASTRHLGERLAESMTRIEYEYLWGLARDHRSKTTDQQPRALSYQRLLNSGVGSSRKALIGTAQRVVKRFKAADLLPAHVSADDQREWICRQAIELDVFEALSRRYGPLPD